MADSLLQRGEFAAAQQEFERVLALYDPKRDRSIPYLPANQFVISSTYFAWALWISGYPERAAKMQAQAFSHAADLNQNITTGYAHCHAGAQLEQLFGNLPAVLAHTKVLDALFSLLCSDAQERIQRTGQHIWLAELHRIDGEVRRAAGQSLSNVEDCFSKALDVSRRQGARMFELRAANTLARLWRDRGKNINARDLLAPVYARFKEGFDAVDLKAARELLAQLSA